MVQADAARERYDLIIAAMGHQPFHLEAGDFSGDDVEAELIAPPPYSVVRLVADHSINRDDIAGPPAGAAPDVIDAAVRFPIFDDHAGFVIDGKATVDAVPGRVAHVALAVGVPPMVTAQPGRGFQVLGQAQVGEGAH